MYRKLEQRKKTRQIEQEYKTVRKGEKKLHRWKKKEYMEREIKELDDISHLAEAKKFYKKLKERKMNTTLE